MDQGRTVTISNTDHARPAHGSSADAVVRFEDAAVRRPASAMAPKTDQDTNISFSLPIWLNFFNHDSRPQNIKVECRLLIRSMQCIATIQSAV